MSNMKANAMINCYIIEIDSLNQIMGDDGSDIEPCVFMDLANQKHGLNLKESQCSWMSSNNWKRKPGIFDIGFADTNFDDKYKDFKIFDVLEHEKGKAMRLVFLVKKDAQ